MQAPTSEQIRNRIDAGRTGEKVAMPDPAAAPLGSDAEAAGNPPTGRERAMDAAATPAPPEKGHELAGGFIYAALVLAIAVALVFIVLLARP